MYRNNNIIVEIACMIALRHFFYQSWKLIKAPQFKNFVSVAQFFAKLIVSVAQFLYHKVF